MSNSMHDLREEGCGDEVEVHVVLFECLRGLHAGAIFYTGEGFKSLSGTDWEIRERAGSRAIERMALSGFDRCNFAHRGWKWDPTSGMIHDDG
jgi:hypothetical protein